MEVLGCLRFPRHLVFNFNLLLCCSIPFFSLSELQNNAIQAVTGKLFGDSGSSINTL